MDKLLMKNPVVEMDGDEMTRVLWRMIKDELILPFVDLKTEYYDLSLPVRDETDDQITLEAGNAVSRWKVGVKCATITPNKARVEEYHLKAMYASPNGTIRSMLDGTTFRKPILTNRIAPNVRTWKKPITIARHSYGDIYKGVEYRVPGPGRAELRFIAADGGEQLQTIYDFKGPGVIQGIHNRDDSIENFARSCFLYALGVGEDLWFSAKDTISKVYDGRFRDVFEALYETEYRAPFEKAGLKYFYTLNDDAVARVMRSEGGFVWALKNYDGDLLSDMISAAFSTLAMMTSVLVSPAGCYVYEAAHGTVTRHFRRYQAGEIPSTNPVATIFAWAGALKKRGELDGTADLSAFADRLARATLDTIEAGTMTKDLAALCPEVSAPADSAAFLQAIRARLETR
jgi:isocitrate dehydrogenase